MKLRTAVASLLITTSPLALAGPVFWDGNRLLEALRAPAGSVDASIGMGFVAGAHDALNDSICPPQGATLGQVRDVVKVWLENNPAKRHFTAFSNVGVAIQDAWPCPSQRR